MYNKSIPKTRQEAIFRNELYYSNGIPCRNGHIAIRHIGEGCVECRKQTIKRNTARAKEMRKKIYNANHYQKVADIRKLHSNSIVIEPDDSTVSTIEKIIIKFNELSDKVDELIELVCGDVNKFNEIVTSHDQS